MDTNKTSLSSKTQKEKSLFSLNTFLDEKEIVKFKKVINRKTGYGFVVGTTGSGKTTFLNEYLLEAIRQVPEITITSYESPIEKIIPGILQIEHDYTDNWFDSVSKILSKVDSDIVAVSEYRTFKEFNEINNNSDRKQILSTTHCKDIRSFFNIIKSYSIEGQEELNEKTIAQGQGYKVTTVEPKDTNQVIPVEKLIKNLNFVILIDRIFVPNEELLLKDGFNLIYRDENYTLHILQKTFGEKLSEEVANLCKSKNIRILNNNLTKLPEDRKYFNTKNTNHCIFKEDIENNFKSVITKGYSEIVDTPTYKLLVSYLSGKLTSNYEGRIGFALQEIENLSTDEKKEILEALMKDDSLNK